LVGDRSGQSVVVHATAPTASAAASATPWPPLAACLIHMGSAGLLVAVILVRFAIFDLHGGLYVGLDRSDRVLGDRIVVTRRSALARPAAAPTPAATPPAAGAVLLACRRLVGKALGLLDFHLGFKLAFEGILVVERLFRRRRCGSSLGRQQGLGGF